MIMIEGLGWSLDRRILVKWLSNCVNVGVLWFLLVHHRLLIIGRSLLVMSLLGWHCLLSVSHGWLTVAGSVVMYQISTCVYLFSGEHWLAINLRIPFYWNALVNDLLAMGLDVRLLWIMLVNRLHLDLRGVYLIEPLLFNDNFGLNR